MTSFLEQYEIDRARALTRLSVNLFMDEADINLNDLKIYWQDCPWHSHQDWLLKKLLPSNWMPT